MTVLSVALNLTKHLWAIPKPNHLLFLPERNQSNNMLCVTWRTAHRASWGRLWAKKHEKIAQWRGAWKSSWNRCGRQYPRWWWWWWGHFGLWEAAVQVQHLRPLFRVLGTSYCAEPSNSHASGRGQAWRRHIPPLGGKGEAFIINRSYYRPIN